MGAGDVLDVNRHPIYDFGLIESPRKSIPKERKTEISRSDHHCGPVNCRPANRSRLDRVTLMGLE